VLSSQGFPVEFNRPLRRRRIQRPLRHPLAALRSYTWELMMSGQANASTATSHNSLDFLFQVIAVSICACQSQSKANHKQLQIRRIAPRGKSVLSVPNGCSISSAIPSMPIRVNATIVTTGIIAQPRSLASVKGRAKT